MIAIKIGYDVSLTGHSKAGCAFYADELIRHLASIDDKNEYLLYGRFYDSEPFKGDLGRVTSIHKSNFSLFAVSPGQSATDSLYGNVDVVHSTSYRFPENLTAKKVVTIYDVVFLDVPEYTTEQNRIICFKATMDSMLFADKILAISEYTKSRLIHFFPMINPDKIEVCYLGNRSSLLKEKASSAIFDRFKLESNEYILSVGTIEPRKNYGTLLKAYKLYKEGLGSDRKKLCIAGGYGWLQENFMDEIASLGLKDDVVVTGYATDEELSNLYRNCYSFIYPSWYEGFGLPIIEAMNFKKPIISSNVTSIPEVAGDAAILLDPYDFEGFAKALLQLQQDTVLYERLVITGSAQADLFSWDNTAKQVLDVYNKLA